jgi:3-deoxy-7-phosphoheptulonate synthase
METVIAGRQAIHAIIHQTDPRLLAIVGPCSIHDETAALEYAQRLSSLQKRVSQNILLVMRVYLEKPRTAVGWKGLINDPDLNGTCDMAAGLRKARRIFCAITRLGIPTATEMLEPVVPQYIADLVSWAAIGARTTESQTHREMASGLSMPVGFKNGTDGELTSAINAMVAARAPQSFLGIDPEGRTSVFRTRGNPCVHLVLRGGRRPNYDSVSVRDAVDLLRQRNLTPTVVVDCSHANSRKRYSEQKVVWEDVLQQRAAGNRGIVGLMLESNLNEGHQENYGDPTRLKYGVSITDACISWEQTEELIHYANDRLSSRNGRNSTSEAKPTDPAVDSERLFA